MAIKNPEAIVVHTDSQVPQAICVPTTGLALDVFPGPHCYLCFYNWPLPLHTHLLRPLAKIVYTTSAGQITDCSGPLQLTLETMLRTSRASEVSADPCNICQRPWNCWCCGLKWLELANHNTWDLVLPHAPSFAPTPLDMGHDTLQHPPTCSWRSFLTELSPWNLKQLTASSNV